MSDDSMYMIVKKFLIERECEEIRPSDIFLMAEFGKWIVEKYSITIPDVNPTP